MLWKKVTGRVLIAFGAVIMILCISVGIAFFFEVLINTNEHGFFSLETMSAITLGWMSVCLGPAALKAAMEEA